MPIPATRWVNTDALQSIVLPADTVFGNARAQTTSRLHGNIARVGVNYGFW